MATTEDFQHDYVQRQSQMDGLVGSHIDSQTKFCDTLRVCILSIKISLIEIFLNKYHWDLIHYFILYFFETGNSF